MDSGRRVRVAVAALSAGLLAVAPAAATPAAAAAQDRCAPAGGPVAPAPWSQLLIGADRVWPLSTGSGQLVAVVSTGVGDPPQLTETVAERVDLAPEPEFGEPSGELDCLGVGTGVAGVIAAQRADGVGFRGMAPGAQILSAKIVDDQFPSEREPANSVAPGVLASGIDWAVDQGATVIVVPTITYQDSEQLQDTVERARAEDIVVVAAVGDEEGSTDQDSAEAGESLAVTPYPAAYEGVIGVGAIGEDTTAAPGSRPGADLVAPGVEIVTTYPRDGLGPASGTGLAAAYVAGSAALLRAYRPGLSHAEVARRLFATATPAPEGVGSPSYGYGIVNPYQALLDRVVDGNPAQPPPYQPAEISVEEQARAAAAQRSESLASRLAGVGLAVAVLLVAAIGFAAKGRRRRWRAGLAATTPDPPQTEPAAPPMDLFADRWRSR